MMNYEVRIEAGKLTVIRNYSISDVRSYINSLAPSVRESLKTLPILPHVIEMAFASVANLDAIIERITVVELM